MGMTIDEAIKHYEDMKKGWYLVNPDELLDFTIDTLRKYQMFQAKYVERLKADMSAILTDLSMEIGEIEDGYTEFDEENKRSLTMIPLESVDRLIQQKINELKADQEGGRMTKKPFLAHSELTNEIYIVVGKEKKYCVTEQAIKAVAAIKALEQEPRWIPCSERLPEDTEIVLLSTETNEVFEGRFFDDDTECQWYTFRDETFLQNHVVLAWMPLPKAYREVEE